MRWKVGAPPVGNANYAWLQHILRHLAPNGTAGVVLANGSMSSMQSGEGDIRRAMVECDVVDCMIALPRQLFYSTPIPACLWSPVKQIPHGTTELSSKQWKLVFGYYVIGGLFMGETIPSRVIRIEYGDRNRDDLYALLSEFPTNLGGSLYSRAQRLRAAIHRVPVTGTTAAV